ncbi:FYVE zinc finger family protein [Aphelenchoides avenae]|nr:FYVE zinc finger family protein [Aphelenchus avenae]
MNGSFNFPESPSLTQFPQIEEDDEPTPSGSGLLSGIVGFFRSSEPAIATTMAQSPAQNAADATENDAEGPLEVDVRNGVANGAAERTDKNDMDSPTSTISREEARSGKFSRLASIFKSKGLPSYEQSDFRRYWMPDSTGKECYECHERFTTFRRRHHCRLCGQIFCAKCTSHQINGSIIGTSKPVAGITNESCRLFRGPSIVWLLREKGGRLLHEPAVSARHGASRAVRNRTAFAGTRRTGRTAGVRGVASRKTSGISIHGSHSAVSLGSDATSIPPSLLSVQHLALSEAASLTLSPPTPTAATNGHTHFALDDDSEPAWVKEIEDQGGRDSFSTPEASLYAAQSSDTGTEAVWNFSDVVEKPPLSRLKGQADVCGTDFLSAGLEESFLQKVEAMLDFLLVREQLDAETWKGLLWPLCKEVVSTVKVDVAGRNDSMNVLDYVHIKKLPVKCEPTYEVISGVVCSHSLCHSSIPKTIDNASVMTLDGSVGYERVLDKFSSLEPILGQEQEFLRNQVDRIVSRRLSLLLVEESVATTAADMLREAEVGVVTNVKHQVLERVARSTNADIMTSLDAQFLLRRTGFCGKFYQRNYKLVSGKKKSLLIFDGCDSALGISVILRGPVLHELDAAKRILRSLILLMYSSKLELDFLNMFNAHSGARQSSCEVCLLNRCGDVGLEDSAFYAALRSTPLTNSPLLYPSVPFLETAVGRNCDLMHYFKKPLFHFLTEEDFVDLKRRKTVLHDDFDSLQNDAKKRKGAIDALVHGVMTRKEITKPPTALMPEYRARSALLARRRYERKREIDQEKSKQAAELKKETHADATSRTSGPNRDMLNPYNHQRISFLYCANSRKSTNVRTFCMGPWLLVRGFYAGKDMTMGTFLSNFCFNVDYKCKTCEKSMMDHLRKIIHKNARIELTTQVYVKPTTDENGEDALPQSLNVEQPAILAWRRCTLCRSNSKVLSVGAAFWHMSFAKYINYLANGSHWASASMSNGECEHCMFHQHHHYFSSRNYIACFKVIPIRPLHVVFSSIPCRVDPFGYSCLQLIDEKTELSRQAEAVFGEALSYARHGLLDSVNTVDALITIVQRFKEKFDELLFPVGDDDLGKLANAKPDDPVYVQITESLMRGRHFLHYFVSQWNSRKADTADGAKMSRTSSSAATDESNSSLLTSQTTIDTDVPLDVGALSLANLRVELPAITTQFPADVHLELPLNYEGQPVYVRDTVDAKGASYPDVGSIVAYAVASKEFKRKKSMWQNSLANGTASVTIDFGAPDSIEIDFADSKAQFFVKAYYEDMFASLREEIFEGGEEAYISSLSRSQSWHPQGGKSGSAFFRTEDERFVFKQLSRFELESFKKCAPYYCDYVRTAAKEKKLTALCKIYGVYRVGYTSKHQSQQLKMDILVMEYLFYKKNVKQVWDLKGSLRNRMASGKSGMPVLLDENLVQNLWGNQLYVHPHAKAALNQAIENDSQFLQTQDIMDYSLLAGICQDRDEVIIGIVDYLRTFTLDKKVESLVKTALPSSHLPTVISPESYRQRFVEAIDGYFSISPDQWTCLDTPMD